MFDPQTLLLSVLLPPFISFALNGLIPPLRKSKYAAALAIFSVFISTLASLILLIKRPGGELIFEWIPAKLFSPFLFGFFLDPFSIVMFILWGATGTFFLPELFVKAPELPTAYLSLCMLLIFFGAMGKSAQFPLHVWLPDAMEGPTPVSALIHAATMVVAGVYLVIRLFPLFQFTPEVLSFVIWIGSITALIGAALALIQEDIKRILASSPVSQIGYMMAVAGAGAKSIAFFHLFTHAFFKALLFLAAGSIIHAISTNNIWQMGRLSKRMPQTTILFLIGALALSGIFPFSGHFSKDEILVWMHVKGFRIHFFILLFTAFLTALYMFRTFFIVFMGDKEAKQHPHESPWVMTLPMWILGLLALIAGFPKESLFKFLGHDSESYHSYIAYLPLSVSILGIMTA